MLSHRALVFNSRKNCFVSVLETKAAGAPTKPGIAIWIGLTDCRWMHKSASIIGAATWYVVYTAPIDLMRNKLHELVKVHSLRDRRVANLQVIDAEQSTVKVRALVSAKNSPDAWNLRCDIRENMIPWLH